MGKMLLKNLHKYSDILTAFVVPIAVIILLFHFDDPVAIYFKLSLGKTFLTVFGVLLGLLLTAYAIFFTITPSLPPILVSTKSYERVATIFFGLILSNIIFVAAAIADFFLPRSFAQLLAGFEITVSIFLLSFTFLMIVYLREIFLDLRYHITRKT